MSSVLPAACAASTSSSKRVSSEPRPAPLETRVATSSLLRPPPPPRSSLANSPSLASSSQASLPAAHTLQMGLHITSTA